jgi:hypothetical protein
MYADYRERQFPKTSRMAIKITKGTTFSWDKLRGKCEENVLIMAYQSVTTNLGNPVQDLSSQDNNVNHIAVNFVDFLSTAQFLLI